MELRPERLPRGLSYGIDTVTLIYFLERHPTFYHPAKRFFQLVERGEISAIVSSLVFSELLVPAFRANEQRRANTIVRVLSNFPNLTVLPMTTPISIAAARLRALHGLRTPDAIHAATAVEAGATGMITNDKHFLKLVAPEFDVWLFREGGS